MRAGAWLVVVLIVSSIACNLTRSDDGDNRIDSGLTSSSPPTVVVRNVPESVAIGQTLTVEAQAQDPTGRGVTKLEMRINDQTVDQKPSPDPAGTTPFSANLSWTPARTGIVTISVLAWRGSVASAPQTLSLTVTSTAQPTATSLTGQDLTPSSPTLGPCRARVDVGSLNFRSVPSTGSDDYIIKAFSLNEEPALVGRLADNSWYQVRDTASSTVGWVSGGYVTVLGSCGNISVVSAPATPTPAPTQVPPASAEPAQVDLVALPISGLAAVTLDESGSATENYSLSIQNQGGQDSGEFSVQIVLPGGEEIIRTVENLNPGQTLNVADDTWQAVTFVAPGTQRISVHVDFDNQIAEANESNNISILDITVTEPPEEE